jgi:hypothetical protein
MASMLCSFMVQFRPLLPVDIKSAAQTNIKTCMSTQDQRKYDVRSLTVQCVEQYKLAFCYLYLAATINGKDGFHFPVIPRRDVLWRTYDGRKVPVQVTGQALNLIKWIEQLKCGWRWENRIINDYCVIWIRL